MSQQATGQGQKCDRHPGLGGGNALESLSSVGLLGAFAGGLIFLPCTLSLLPAYLSVVTGGVPERLTGGSRH